MNELKFKKRFKNFIKNQRKIYIKSLLNPSKRIKKLNFFIKVYQYE